MKKNAFMAAILFAAGSLLAADPKETVTAAAKKLEAGGNFAWKSTVDAGEGGFGGGVTQGKTAAGITWTSTPGFAFGGGDAPPPTERLFKGTNSVTKSQEGTWQTAEEIAAANGGGGGGRRGGFGGFGGGAMVLPTTTISELMSEVKSLKDENGVLVGDLTDEGAKANVMPFGRRGGRRGGAGGPGGGGPGGGGGFTPPEATDAKGSVKIWIKDGVLTKYEMKNSGNMSMGGNDISINRTTTVEFSEIGKAKVDAPADALKKLGN